MKKFLKFTVLPLLAVCMIVAFSACSSPYKEVAGKYNMTALSGTVAGVSVNKSMFELFRLTLDENGNAVLQSKGVTDSTIASKKGTYIYKDDNIYFTVKNGQVYVTEVFTHKDGVLNYKMNATENNIKINISVTLKKAVIK